MRLKRGDTVQIITGRDRPRRPEDRRRPSGKVLRVYPEKGKVEVEGKNLVWKHLRKSERYPRGARIQREAPIDASNIALFCPQCQAAVRVRLLVEANPDATPGKPKARRVRICKGSADNAACTHRFD